MNRLVSLDALRGLVVVIMALDHSRDFFSNSHAYFDPIDLTHTTVGLFLTRWITNFCAPVFSFLAGCGIFFSAFRGKPLAQLSRTLVTRGLWLIFLEIIVVRFFWYFNFDMTFLKVGVLWCLGWSMIFLAGLIYLPYWGILGISLLLILPHNLLDVIKPEDFGSLYWLWIIFHVNGNIAITDTVTLKVLYPLIPWLGVMAAGYCFGKVMVREREYRQKFLLGLGFAMIFGFVILRGFNIYGDPVPWTAQKDGLLTFLNILACEKYPPSVSYLLITMGPAILLLAALDRPMPNWLKPFVTFGAVPFLFYVLHLPLLHIMGVLVALYRYGEADWLFANPPGQNWPYDFHWDLTLTYIGWIIVTIMLFPICRWFAQVKSRRKDWWLSYL